LVGGEFWASDVIAEFILEDGNSSQILNLMHIALIAKQIQFSHALQFYHFNLIERFLLVHSSRSEVKWFPRGSFWSSFSPFLCVTEISVIKSERGDDMVQGPGRTDVKQKEPQNGTDKT